jgi:hypothetical protein
MTFARGVVWTLACAVGVLGCHGVPSHKALRLARESTPACPSIYPVAVTTLLEHPYDFENECVAVRGFYQLDRVFLTRDHALIGESALSVQLRDETQDGAIAQSACQGQYVFLVAKFVRLPDDPLRDPRGNLEGVQEMFRIELEGPHVQSEQCWPAT